VLAKAKTGTGKTIAFLVITFYTSLVHFAFFQICVAEVLSFM
jgi:superfamily II DNA/RNA helicase